MECCIYRIINKKNGKCYVGQTIDIQRRYRTHFNKLKNNTHINKKLQNAYNKYGREDFDFTFEIFETTEEGLNQLEIETIAKYDSFNNGYNLTCGGENPPNRQKMSNEELANCLCIVFNYNQVGKTLEEILGYSKGTITNLKCKKRYLGAWETYEHFSEEEKKERAKYWYNKWEVDKIKLKREMKQGGCRKAYCLKEEDYLFAFHAQQLGYSYRQVANYLGISFTTVKDWFNGRSRKKEKQIYLKLNKEELQKLDGRVKIAELNGEAKS